MKKLFLFALFSLVLLSSSAMAAGIPLAVDPQNEPEVWTTEVYNNSGGSLGSGTVVVWDFNSVTTPAGYTDRLNYVTTTITADDIRVAGVLLPNDCPNGAVCSIAIRGPVYAYTADSTDALTASQSVATTTLRGQCGQAGTATVNTGILGYAISAAPNTVANGGLGGTDGGDNTLTPIYVQVSNN